MKEFTQGPWVETQYSTGLHIEAAGQTICFFAVDRYDTAEEARANARLVAAAPELLAACKEWAEVDGPTVSLQEQRARWNGIMDRMRAAIMKAEGQTA